VTGNVLHPAAELSTTVSKPTVGSIHHRLFTRSTPFSWTTSIVGDASISLEVI